MVDDYPSVECPAPDLCVIAARQNFATLKRSSRTRRWSVTKLKRERLVFLDCPAPDACLATVARGFFYAQLARFTKLRTKSPTVKRWSYSTYRPGSGQQFECAGPSLCLIDGLQRPSANRKFLATTAPLTGPSSWSEVPGTLKGWSFGRTSTTISCPRFGFCFVGQTESNAAIVRP